VAKDTLQESSSEYAQGGIAAALSDDDDIELHEQDTLNAGAGLCDPDAVRTLVEQGPGAIEQLIEWGAEFDREGSKLVFAREGAHSRSRVLHAHGDSTGSEIARTLYRKAASLRHVTFDAFAAVTDLLLASDGSCAGARVFDKKAGESLTIRAQSVMLATGGLGQVYRETTNPPVATGDGVAAAWRAGATISDIEFVQFHPTALFIAGAPRFLISEALRGEGAQLRNLQGERFMTRYHELLELAPRDVVSRSIFLELQRTGTTHVLLDLTHLNGPHLQRRFPRIYATCKQYGIDLTMQPIPVHPAVHYAMGGVRTDLDGRTDVPGLFAAGEVACTGVHGANRLASNSLLEGIVYGERAGSTMRDSQRSSLPAHAQAEPLFPRLQTSRVKSIAWEHCGIARDAAGLESAIAELEAAPLETLPQLDPACFELRNIHAVALLIARAALARRESRGGHYRTDFPQPQPEFQRHSLLQKHHEVRFE
jgi:L-aspartate oxidase